MIYSSYHNALYALIASITGLKLNYSSAFSEPYYWFTFEIKGSKSQKKAALKNAKKALNTFWFDIINQIVVIPEVYSYEYAPDHIYLNAQDKIVEASKKAREAAIHKQQLLEDFKAQYRVAFESFCC